MTRKKHHKKYHHTNQHHTEVYPKTIVFINTPHLKCDLLIRSPEVMSQTIEEFSYMYELLGSSAPLYETFKDSYVKVDVSNIELMYSALGITPLTKAYKQILLLGGQNLKDEAKLGLAPPEEQFVNSYRILNGQQPLSALVSNKEPASQKVQFSNPEELDKTLKDIFNTTSGIVHLQKRNMSVLSRLNDKELHHSIKIPILANAINQYNHESELLPLTIDNLREFCIPVWTQTLNSSQKVEIKPAIVAI